VALNIKNHRVEALAAELSEITGDSKTETIRIALEHRRTALARRGHLPDRRRAVTRFLENEVWPLIPSDQIGHRPTGAEEDDILGYGTDGA
jgi:antitoxin VapB